MALRKLCSPHSSIQRSGLVPCGSRCKTRETLQISLGNCTKMMSTNRLTALGGSDLSRHVQTLWSKGNPSRTLYGHRSEKGLQSSLEPSSEQLWVVAQPLLTLGSCQLVPHTSSCSQSKLTPQNLLCVHTCSHGSLVCAR